MKKTTLVFLLFTSSFNLFSQEYIPKSSGEIIKHQYYTLSYNEKHEQANWVHYKINPDFLNGFAERRDKFREDPIVSSKSASLNDYKGSGYDRGHLVPAADMKYNAIAMSETFYMSNMSPQKPGFNRGVWKRLESLVRAWGNRFEIYVSTAGVLSLNGSGFIGSNKVTIPSKYYKVIYAPEKKIMIAFLLSNAKQSGDLSSFVVSVDKIEALTGIDFFSELPDTIENDLESNISLKDWDFKVASSSGSVSENSLKIISFQCKGFAKSSGNQCRKKTTNSNKYCYLHQSQSNNYNPSKSKKSIYTGRCNANTKAGA